jgi:TonB family protein
MYFNFDDAHPETPTISTAISRREGILLSIIVHLVFTIVILLAPQLPFVQAIAERQQEAARQQREALLAQQREQQPRFVFVEPLRELPPPAAPPPRADLSDRDRVAQAPERAENPTNPLPFSRGNTTERVDSELMERQQRQRTEQARAAAAGGGSAELPAVDSLSGSLSIPREQSQPGLGRGAAGTGVLGDAVRNIERYAPPEKFQNLGGGAGEYGPYIQFDTKGVDFGPWIRRFIAQIKRNWFWPYAAMSMKGHVVITFYVHRDGRISELGVLGPSAVDAFNNAAYNALAWSNPTQPLPPEYPADRAFFTVTFFYNETPPQE